MKITKKRKYLISAIGGGGIILVIAIVVPLTINKDKKTPPTFNLQEIKNQMHIAINSKTLLSAKAAIVKMYQNGTKLALSSQAQKAAATLAKYVYDNKATKVFTFKFGQDQKGNQLLLTISSSNKATNKTKNIVKITNKLKWVRDALAKVEFGILFQIYQQRLSSQQTLDGTKIANREIKATDFQREKTPQEKLQAKLAQETIQKLVVADFTTGINKNKIAELGQPNQDDVVADIRKKISNPYVKTLILPSDITIIPNNIAKIITIIINNHGPSKTIIISGFLSIKDALDQVLTNIPSSGALIIPKGITSSQFATYVQAMGDVLDEKGKFVMNKFAEGYQAKITSLTLPNSFITIGDEFKDFNKITSLTLGNKLQTIGNEAFFNAKLTSLTIPNSVTSIGDIAFGYSPLISLTLGKKLQIIGISTFYTAQLKSLIIPNSVTSIGNKAFYTAQLKSLIIPNSVTQIGAFAFRGAQLTSLDIPNSVTSIGNSAFSGAHLKSLTLGAKLQTIGTHAFWSAKLTSLTIPNSVTSIGAFAFWTSPLKSLTLGAKLQTIGRVAFYKAQLTSLIIPNLVTSIGESAFGLSPLKSLTLGAKLQAIGTHAFASAKLTFLTIPDAVTWIGGKAFFSSHIPSVQIFKDVIITDAFKSTTWIQLIPRPIS